MPLTVPSIITQYARGGGSLVYLLDVEPSVVDSWTVKRFATAAVEVAGDAYEDATLGGLNRIGCEAKIIQGGNVATLPDVTCTLINKDRLNETLVSDNIEGRQAVVRVTAIGPNMCLNSSFEKRDGDDFVNWTEHASGLGGSVTAETVDPYDSATCCRIVSTNATEGSYITSDEMIWKIGSKVVFSTYAITNIGTASLAIAIHVGTLHWYNASTNTFGIGKVLNTFGTATAAWQRFTLEMDWYDWYSAVSGQGELQDQPIYIELWCMPNESIYVDAVQAELNQQVTPYQHNRYELDADDVMTVFTGIVKNPAWSASEISISLEAWESNKHRDIPKTILTAATDATWTVPKDALGKPFPMTYGDFSSDGLTVWNPSDAGLYEFARGLLVNSDPDATGGILIYFDRPSMKLYMPGGGVYRLYHFCEDDGRFYEQMYYDKAGYAYSSREWVEDFASHPRWKSNTSCYWNRFNRMPLMAALRTKYEMRFDTWTDWLKTSDGTLSTYGYTAVGDVPATTKTLFLNLSPFSFDADRIMEGTAGEKLIYMLGDFSATAGFAEPVTLTVNLYTFRYPSFMLVGCGDMPIWTAESTDCSWRNVPASRASAPAADKLLTQLIADITDWSVFSSYLSDMRVYVDITYDAGNSATARVYEAGLLIYFYIDGFDTTNFASQLYGRTFGTTWNSRKTAANMVESAPEVIESIIREELDGVDADIAETMFDAADTARPQAAAGQLHETRNSMDVIKGVCKDFGLLYYIDTVGKHSLINLDWRAVNKHLFLRDWYKPHEQVKVSYTPRAEIMNDLILHYDRIQFTDEYRRLAYCNKDGYSGTIGATYQAKCAASYAELGNKVQALELSCDWIKTDATAEAMAQWTVDWLYMQRMVITGELFMNCIDLALGDIVTVDMEPLLPASFTETARFMVKKLIVNRKTSRISVELLEVKEP